MDTFDYIIVAIGLVLIGIGLLLFIGGKRESAIANNVEGFGIKLNVSNPSIILIVLGIGLLLVPRFLPSTSPQTSNLNSLQTSSQLPKQAADSSMQSPISSPTESQENSSQNAQNQSDTSSSNPKAFFPTGDWVLSRYEENGVDLSNAIGGSIRFSQPQSDSQQWYAQMEAVDVWGNYLNYFYQGDIRSVPSGHTIVTNNSNDPSFVPQGATNLIMKMDDAYTLHMEYFFNGSKIVLHFTR